jgi:hypothetical protein
MTDEFEDIEVLSVPPPDISKTIPEDERYLILLTKPLDVCAKYRPKFGQGGTGVSVEEFQLLYGGDSFYSWMGLDSPLMYAAHKAAGGMTSVYRQLGIGAQWIFNQVLQDHLGLTKEEANWTYQVPSTNPEKVRSLSLDARLEPAKMKNAEAKARVQRWMDEAHKKLLLPQERSQIITGAVFEARQGYKSKDSKRQNADISNASNAYVHGYIPVLLLFSNQLDQVLAERYSGAQWLILRGVMGGSPLDSTYAFCRDVVGYDLAAFFERNSAKIRSNMEQTLKALLSA